MDRYLDRNQNKNLLFLKMKNKKFIKEFVKNKYLINNVEYNNLQKEAIATDELNTLVIAGAGTGKTMTIVGKIDYLINNLGVKENEILCLSFTNDSVKSLKEKIDYNVDIFTFHKLAIEIIRDYNIFFNICSSDYLEYIVNEIFISICKTDNKIIKDFINKICSFINLYKVHELDNIDYLIKKNKDKLLKVIKLIMNLYSDELISQNMYDFNDLISYACELIKQRGLKRYYRYIIIDEYQDISKSRYELIKLIKESCFSKIFAVGDDFQSIYKFSGSNIEMIINFKKYFGYTRVIKLLETYRNSNELIKVATKFITRNKYQIKKKLFSKKTIIKPVKIIYYKKNQCIKLKKILDDKKYLILVRNTFDINSIIDKEIIKEDNYIIYKDRSYRFMTVHKSKGLEEDNVIIINLNNSYLGFPNKIENDINKLIIKKEKYLYEEERRLFYVALTRTRNYVYLLVDYDNPSVFVKELLRRSKNDVEVIKI